MASKLLCIRYYVLPTTPRGKLLARTLSLGGQRATQATTLTPTGVQNVRPLGPCRAPSLTCPPPPCACPPPVQQPVTVATRAIRVVWMLTKLGLFVAVTKFTIDEGLWGSGAETEDLALRMGLITDPDTQTDKEETVDTVGERGWWDSAILKIGEYFGLDP